MKPQRRRLNLPVRQSLGVLANIFPYLLQREQQLGQRRIDAKIQLCSQGSRSG